MRFSKSAIPFLLRFILRPWTLLVLCSFLFLFFLLFFLDSISRLSGITEASNISWPWRWFARSRCFSEWLYRAKQPWPHRRYLPSGINQLNAQLLEASASLKPILLTFLFYLPILFPLAPTCSRGGRYLADLPRLLIQLAFLPSIHTRHSGSSLPSSLTTLRSVPRSSHDRDSCHTINRLAWIRVRESWLNRSQRLNSSKDRLTRESREKGLLNIEK